MFCGFFVVPVALVSKLSRISTTKATLMRCLLSDVYVVVFLIYGCRII